jgi:GNAT superfamily N-acetyltransferase
VALKKLSNLKKRFRNGELGYYVKRLFPGGNMFLYGGVQLVFRLSDLDKFEEIFELVKRRFGHEVRCASSTDIERLCGEFPDSAAIFRTRVRRGNRCYVSIIDDEIAAFLWAMEPKGNYFDTNTMWVFRPEEMDGVWGTHGYVKPKYRLKGLFPFLMGVARHDYMDKGYVRLYGETHGGNRASIQTHLSAGYEIVWRVVYVSILGLKIYVAKNQKSGRSTLNFRYALRIENHKI